MGGLRHLYNKLFRPSDNLTMAMQPHRIALGERYESYSFRFQSLLGDFKDTMTEPLEKSEAEDLMARCGEELIRLLDQQPDGTRALVASDSGRFLDYAARLDSRVYVIPGIVAHSDQNTGGKSHDDVWMKTFVDQHMIMGAEKVHLIRTGQMYDSGFPAFAAHVGGRPFIKHEF